ncbi:SGNH/GDSL hydrolase family protein [Sphingomonas sp. QA11]|uniref:SGNH/GDSL hydrolase family protein n=1 Tax=Sphingomonas sp. QA11 TaxID=2950605 RepID=UPI00234AAF58|nr:SGNH/GDSL hydrolase family protein [Sphingomonas sp. QA11]WCM27398.1 SGNH/GDSL hydrolase family protein [Sphingomonas sp. QA11]
MLKRANPWAASLAFVLVASFSLTAAAQEIVIFGDSTGKGDGAVTRWFDRMLEKLPAGPVIENHSRSRFSITAILKSMESPQTKSAQLVIIYDRRNAGETVDAYLEHLHRIAETASPAKLLILPQVPVSGGREDGLTLAVLQSINTRILAEFPDNTFDQATQESFLSDLSGDDTRSDHIHRNDKGQEIEAEYIARWLSTHPLQVTSN